MTLHALVTSDFHLEGLKTLFPVDGTQRLLHEIDKIFQYAVSRGIRHVFVPGDISDIPHMDYSTYIGLVLLLKKYDNDLNIYYIAGNHDFSDVKKTSMDFLKVLEQNGFFANFRLFLKPDTLEVEGQRINFLPYPINRAPESKYPTLNFAHIEANGAIGDNGRRMKVHEDYACQDKHFTISGHIHQYQYMKNKRLIFCGNPYQKNFGETTEKGFIEVKIHQDSKQCQMKHRFVASRPEFRLITQTITDSKDISKLSTNIATKYRLYVDPDVVLPKDFRLRYPNVAQVLDLGSKRSIDVNEQSSTDNPSKEQSNDQIYTVSPLSGLKPFLREEGLNKRQLANAKSAVLEALSEIRAML